MSSDQIVFVLNNSERNMPKNIRIKIRRYLDYQFEKLKEIKVDDKDIFKELN